MKRKDFDDASCNDLFSVSSLHFPSRKARRLDGDSIGYMQEDLRLVFPELIDGGPLLKSQQTSSCMVPTNVSELHPMPPVNSSDEKALVLYHPPELPTLFLKSPCPSQFPLVFDSDLIPGIRDHIPWLQSSKATPSVGNAFAYGDTVVKNDCMAVVPWIDSQISSASVNQQPTDLSDPMDSEEVEMMDSEVINSGTAFEFSGIVEVPDGMCHATAAKTLHGGTISPEYIYSYSNNLQQ